jgi:hypothetical protein
MGNKNTTLTTHDLKIIDDLFKTVNGDVEKAEALVKRLESYAARAQSQNTNDDEKMLCFHAATAVFERIKRLFDKLIQLIQEIEMKFSGLLNSAKIFVKQLLHITRKRVEIIPTLALGALLVAFAAVSGVMIVLHFTPALPFVLSLEALILAVLAIPTASIGATVAVIGGIKMLRKLTGEKSALSKPLDNAMRSLQARSALAGNKCESVRDTAQHANRFADLAEENALMMPDFFEQVTKIREDLDEAKEEIKKLHDEFIETRTSFKNLLAMEGPVGTSKELTTY